MKPIDAMKPKNLQTMIPKPVAAPKPLPLPSPGAIKPKGIGPLLPK